MKKTFSFLLCFCIALSMLPLYAGAETANTGNITWNFDDSNATLTISGKGDMPDYSESNPAPWQDCLDKISEVIFGEGITSIGNYAFYPYKYSFLDITVPESLKKIGNSAFAEVKDKDTQQNLGNLNAVNYLGTPEDYKNIQIGTGNTGLEHAGIYYNKINSPVSGIYQDETGNLSDIKWTLDVNRTLTVSGKGDMPFFKKEAGLYDNNGYYDSLVKKIIVKEGITGISSFVGFENLEEVILPSTVKTISNSCFRGDIKLRNIVIPNQTESIDEYAFCETGIENLKIPESVKSIGTGVINDTPLYNNDSNWENGTLYIDNRLIDAKDTLTGAITVKPGTVGIAGGSIKGNIISLLIPKSVQNIDSYAFAYSIPENICFEGSEEEWNKIFSAPDEWDENTKKPTLRFNVKMPGENNADEQSEPLPVRFTAENLGAVVTWNGEKQEVTIKGRNTNNEEITILIYIGSDIAYVNSEQVKLDFSAYIENDRTYAPVSFIYEKFGASIE